MIQWHPLFAELLRHMLEAYYTVETNVPVGDLPREADITLVRLTSPTPPPFVGIWKHLTPWNVIEFKGPSDDPSLRDLDLLVEVGLGIDRRLNEQRTRDGQPLLEREMVSFWFVANHLGRRFLAHAEKLLGVCERLSDGLWRCWVMQRAVFLVSRDALPVELETVPLHLVCQEPEAVTLQVAQVLLQQPDWWQFGRCLLLLHPNLKEELIHMAKMSGTDEIDLRPLFTGAGSDIFIRQLLSTVKPTEAFKQVIEEFGLEQFLASLTPEQREELKNRLQ